MKRSRPTSAHSRVLAEGRVSHARRGVLRAALGGVAHLLLLLALCPPAQSQGTASQEGRPRLRTVTDMVAVPDGAGVTIYAADEGAGAIFYYAARAGGETGPINLADFKWLVSTGPRFPNPSSLAYWQGKLFGCDSASNELFEIDLKSAARDNPATPPIVSSPPPPPAVVPLQVPGLLKGALYVAVSETGVLAVASDNKVQYLAPGAAEPRLAAEGLSDVDRLAFDGSTLVVLDEDDEGELFGFDTGAHAPPGPARAKDYPRLLPDDSRGKLRKHHLQDFAPFRGIYYAASKERLLAFARPQEQDPVGPSVLSMEADRQPFKHVTRVAVSESSVYFAQKGAEAVLAVPRPVPLVVDFPNASPRAADEQLAIYRLLNRTGALLRQVITSAAGYESVSDFVRSEVFAQTGSASAPSPSPFPVSRPLQAEMSDLVCQLNGWKCETRQDRQGPLVFRSGTKIGQDHEVVVPAAEIKAFHVETVDRGTARQVALGAYLAGRDIVPVWDQAAPLSAGDIVRLAVDEQGAPSALGRCAAGAPVAVDATTTVFPEEVLLDPAALPRQATPQATPRSLRSVGVARVVAQYQGLKFEQQKLTPEERGRECQEALNDPGAYIVESVLFAESVRYRFLDRNGRQVYPSQTALAAVSLRGQPDSGKRWNWVAPGRLNLGYVAYRFTSHGPEQAAAVSYLEALVPTTRVYTQQLTLLVEAGRTEEVLEALNLQAVGSNPMFYASSAQDLTALAGGGQSVSARPGSRPPADQGQALQEAVNSRRRLNDLIHFPSGLAGVDFRGVKVGVVEDLTSLEDGHQCFYNDAGTEWTWGQLSTTVKVPPNPGEVRPRDQFKKVNDHATHVAAIMAARRVLPGLLPSLRLVRINAAQLEAEMETNQAKVHIYNISVQLRGKDSLYTSLVNKINNGVMGKKTFLLVVAAGNVEEVGDVPDLSEPVTPPRPVVWLRYLPENVIVVGASRLSDPYVHLDGTNYSKKYVQLLAPGEEVYSATRNNTYTPASGTSQAAPQVAAVAAILQAKNVEARWIKAALIYTADWQERGMEEAWGGALNAERALGSVSGNSLWLSEAGAPLSFLTPESGFRIKVARDARINDPNKKRDSLPVLGQETEIDYDDLLRVQRMGSGRFRIIYVDKSGVMTMLTEANITEGKIKCVVTGDANDACPQFATGGKREGEIPFDRIGDYIRKVPSGPLVSFPLPN